MDKDELEVIDEGEFENGSLRDLWRCLLSFKSTLPLALRQN